MIGRGFVAAAAVAFALTVFDAEASAQEGWFFDLSAGAAIPMGDVGDFLGTGPTFGAAAGQEFENVAVGLSFDLDLLPGKDFESVSGPGANFYHYRIFGEYGFRDPRTSNSQISLILGAGAATISTDEVQGEKLTDTYATLEGGVRFGFGAFFVEGVWIGMFGTDGTDQVFPDNLDSMMNITAKAGIRIG